MRKSTFLVALAWCVLTISAQAAYKETLDSNSPAIDVCTKYGLVDDGAKCDQTAKLQKAIDETAEAGGGRLVIRKGTYQFAGVYLKSNVHLFIEAGSVIKPYWSEDQKVVVFILDAQPATNNKAAAAQAGKYIENVSIRGLNGHFTVDYSHLPRRAGVRAVLCRMVKNFLISDMDIKDNCTIYSGIALVPTRWDGPEVRQWPVSRPTDGTIRNCRIFNASPGYGLVQLHGAQSVHFENLYALGGVALRLETGAGGENTGVYDITAKNIVCENGRCAVMLGPHSAQNGVVKVDGVLAKSCAYAVQIGKGSVKKSELARNPNAKPGSFAPGTTIRNVRAIFGWNAQIKTHAILEVPEPYLDYLKLRPNRKFFDGPSIGGIKDTTEGAYHVRVENVTLEGFTYNADKKILTPSDFRPGKWPQALRQWKAEHGITD